MSKETKAQKQARESKERRNNYEQKLLSRIEKYKNTHSK